MKSLIFLTAILFAVVNGKEYNSVTVRSRKLFNDSIYNVEPPGKNLSSEESNKIKRNFTNNLKENSFFFSKRQVRKHYLEPLIKIILETWQRPREQILNNHVEIEALNRFIIPTMNLINNAYSERWVKHDFFLQLRALWVRKPKKYSLKPFLEHIWYINSMQVPNMFGDTDFFINRVRLEILNSTDQFLPVNYFGRLLNIHVVDPSANALGNDFFSSYGGRIRALDFFWEVHVMECFRVLFATLEILERYKINRINGSSHDDAVEDCVNAEIIEMIENNTVYSNYLLNKKRKELSLVGDNNDANIIRERLERNIRVREAELLMLFWTRIQNLDKTMVANCSTAYSDLLQQYQCNNKSLTKNEEFNSAKSKYSEKSNKCYDIDFENPIPSCSGMSSRSQQHGRNMNLSSSEDETINESTSNLPSRNSNSKGKTFFKSFKKCHSKKTGTRKTVYETDMSLSSSTTSSYSQQINKNVDANWLEDPKSEKEKVSSESSKKPKIHQNIGYSNPGPIGLQSSSNSQQQYRMDSSSSDNLDECSSSSSSSENEENVEYFAYEIESERTANVRPPFDPEAWVIDHFELANMLRAIIETFIQCSKFSIAN